MRNYPSAKIFKTLASKLPRSRAARQFTSISYKIPEEKSQETPGVWMLIKIYLTQ